MSFTKKGEMTEVTIFVVETCVIKTERMKEFRLLMQRVSEYKEKNPELFREVKSWRLFRQMFGGTSGAYTSMWEFENLTHLEKCWAKEEKDKSFQKMHQELLQLIEPATFNMEIWSSAM